MSVVSFIVDRLYALFVSNTSVEEVLLNATPEQRQKRLQLAEKRVEKEIFMAECEARRKQRALQRKLEHIHERKELLALTREPPC